MKRHEPRCDGHRVGLGHAEEHRENRDRQQAYDDHRFPSDAVRCGPPKVAAQEPAERERAGHVAGVKTWVHCFV